MESSPEEIEKQNSDTAKLTLEQKLSKKRKEVKADIEISVNDLRDIKKITSVQVNMLSLRQRLVEDNHDLYDIYNSLNKKYRQAKSKEYQGLNQSQYRYQNKEKDIMVDGKESELKHNMDCIQNQISYYESSIKTVDSILFGLKLRMDVEHTFGALPYR